MGTWQLYWHKNTEVSRGQWVIIPQSCIIWSWMENGAKLHDDNIWWYRTWTVAHECLMPYLAKQIHSLGQIGNDKMICRFDQVWWNPKFHTQAWHVTRNCVTSIRTNREDKQDHKRTVTKISPEGMFWPEALPTVLCSIRATHSTETGLNPFEIITAVPCLYLAPLI